MRITVLFMLGLSLVAWGNEPSMIQWLAKLGLDPCHSHYTTVIPLNPLARVLRHSWKTRKHLGLEPEVEILRRITLQDWSEVSEESRPALYAEKDMGAWQNAKRFAEAHAKDAELGPELLKEIHSVATEGHYFIGFERRRIQGSIDHGKIPADEGMKLLEEMKDGEKPLYSGVNHESLRGIFRKDLLDAFVQNGRHLLPDGSRYFTATELAQIRENPYLRVEEASFKDIGEGRFVGNVHFVAPSEVEKAVASVFATLKTELAEAKDDLAKIGAIVRFRRQMLTVHPFLDGNGRSIRLFADLLFERHGFPPPLTFHEDDLTITHEQDVKSTVVGMQLYLMALKTKEP